MLPQARGAASRVPAFEAAAPPGARDAPQRIRARIRSGAHTGLTTGMAPGFVQANLVVLPAAQAEDFRRYCDANARACPLLAMSEPGDPALPALGDGIDVRFDLPRYRVFRDGQPVDEVTDLDALWRDDLVTFALGCSYSFEWALQEAGVPLRHLEIGSKVCTYLTGLDTVPAGPFRGKLVVSMRPFAPADAVRAADITSRFPRVHGAPVHRGDPGAIGIRDLAHPEFGGVPALRDGDELLFWACGVTPQVAIRSARPPLAITHKAGHMLVSDRLNSELADPGPGAPG